MELSERMLLTVAGQVTWASPEIGKKCVDCRQYDQSDMICKKVKLVCRTKGKPFDGRRAIACSVFEALDTKTPNL